MEYQKTAEATGNEATDAVPKLQNGTIMKFQKICNKIILKQLQMRMIKKYLQKDTYFQKKYEKLLIM